MPYPWNDADSQTRPPLVILPITSTAVDRLLSSGSPGTWFSDASRLETACVYLLGMLPKLASNPDKAAHLLQRALNDLLQQLNTPAALAEFRRMAAMDFDPTQLRQSLDLIPALRVDLQFESEKDAAPAVNADGTLNGDFNADVVNRRLGKSFYSDDPTLQKLGLNTHQSRIATAILGDPEEPVHIQGFAGTGKTHMIRAILQSLPGEHTAILAKTQGQLQGMLSDVDMQNVHHFLFGQFARDHLIDAGIPPGAVRGLHAQLDFNISDGTIADTMGYGRVGSLTPEGVAKAVRAILFKFCESDASVVGPLHLTYAHLALSAAEQRLLIGHAQAYWDQLTGPSSSERWQPVRQYHLIKWASLVPKKDRNSLRVSGTDTRPLDLKFALVDEAHDLTPAMACLLDQCGVAVYSLGDTFQNVQGAAPRFSSHTLRREMNLSMRAGEGIGVVINPVLEAHPAFQKMEVLKGSKELDTQCQFYLTRRIPKTPYAILCGTHFHVFEYLHQLVNAGARVSLLPGTAFALPAFVDALLMLHRGYRPSSSDLFRFRDWDALEKSYGRMQVFGKIKAMLMKGYSATDFKNIMSKVQLMGRGHYTLGRVEDAKNWQFPNVMLSPELITPNKQAQYVASGLSKVYLAASRAQRTVAVPERLHEWIETQSQLKS